MERIQIEKFKSILSEELDRLMNQARASAKELASEDGHEIENLERATRQTSQDLQLRIRTRECRLIKKVQLALERLADGTYGDCELCGEPISVRRLQARPVTTKCIDCKEQEERMEALYN